jgi:FtsH-binding integral membrane protein
MFLNGGWLGGFVFAFLVLVTCLIGFAHALRSLPSRPLFLVAYAAFLGVALEGFVIDIDHWRHFYLLFALVWGLITAPVPRRSFGIG